MSNFTKLNEDPVYPQIPLPVVIGIPFLFIFFILFTSIRYEFAPPEHITNGTTVAALSIGFVFLYALQKYDKLGANFPVVLRNIIFLTDLALEYDPSLICYLTQYLEDFSDFNNTGYPIITFEEKLLPNIDDENLIFRIRGSVTTLERLSDQRITGENLISAPIWYTVFLSSTLLTLFLAMDIKLSDKTDSILLIVLIWFPVLTIYVLYLSILAELDTAIKDLIANLNKITDKNGIDCSEVGVENKCGINNQ